MDSQRSKQVKKDANKQIETHTQTDEDRRLQTARQTSDAMYQTIYDNLVQNKQKLKTF